MAEYYETYIKNKYIEENTFINHKEKRIDIPGYACIKENLPKPIWENHEDVIKCYDKAWEIAFGNLHNPMEGSGFVAPFMDAAFNGCIFMWDSCFMLMFGKYASMLFPFQETLDNFYAFQHKDGFISREINEKDGSEKFHRHDPTSTGPNVMAWCEWEYYQYMGDSDRLNKVFPVLLAYHQWLKSYRTWTDGSYWSSGWGCGMDNLPRQKDKSISERYYSHGHMVWSDACLQQILSCNVLIDMAKVCGREVDVKEIVEERDKLKQIVNEKLWDAASAFYYDLWDDGQLNMIKSIGAYWALLADAVPEDRIEDFVAHLKNEKEFNRPNRVPTLAADSEYYAPDGKYWCGSIWAPTNYMVLKGLEKLGYDELAFEIAESSLMNVVNTYKETGTIWENYAPEYIGRGSIAKPDFVGWSGLFPISILFEFVFGLKWDVEKRQLKWDIRLTDEFGVENFPLGNMGRVNLICMKRENKQICPVVNVSADVDFTLVIAWDGQERIIPVHKSRD